MNNNGSVEGLLVETVGGGTNCKNLLYKFRRVSYSVYMCICVNTREFNAIKQIL